MADFNQREYQTVILAALLHDVGKMLQRGSFGSLDTSGKHPQVSSVFVGAFKEFFSEFIDFELFQTLVKRHHEDQRNFDEDLLCQNAPEQYMPLSFLVSRADNYSSSERGKKAEIYQDFKRTPLVSVLSRIKLNKGLPDPQKYRLAPLSPENAFPQKFETYEGDEFNRHLTSFGKEFKDLIENLKHADFDTMLSHIMSLLLKYAWCIPANTQEDIPDISLFDHLKTTSAIASCLYQYHFPEFKIHEIKDDHTEKFILLAGDLSGIQNYIFNITHIGAGGIAKRLRSRSFQLAMIAEIISHKILHDFNLPLTNILMVSGGKFYIILPNKNETQGKLCGLQNDIDLWFYQRFNAEINLNMAYVAASGKDFGGSDKRSKGFEGVLEKLNKELQNTKKRPFKSILASGLWSTEKMVLNVDFASEEKLCKACKKFPGEFHDKAQTHLCDRCTDDEKIGRLLPGARHISFYKDGSGEFKGPCGYSFDLKEKPSSSAYLVMSLDEYRPDYRFPYSLRHVAHYIPVFKDKTDCDGCRKKDSCTNKTDVEKGLPKFFECIAQSAEGRPLLGYLKADADNLGQIFIRGLGENKTVSRIATLSRMLDVFFSGYIQKLMEDKYKQLYTVYSGGDDVLVIGPWNKIIDFAEELNREFGRFCSGNKNLTISAGIGLVKHNYPVFRAVEMADNDLDAAKNSGRDRITIFGHTITWDELLPVLNESDILAKWLKDNNISTGFARNLLYYANMHQKYIKEHKPDYLRFLPLLTYDIARNLPSLDDRDENKKIIRLWAEDLKDLANPKLKNLDIIANYALTANRGGKE